MNSSQKALLEFIARLTYNIEGLPGELKLYLSQFFSFHFSKTLSKNQIQDIENRKAGKAFDNNDEILKAAQGFSADERLWTVASIQLLRNQAEKIDNKIVSRRIDALLKELIFLFNLENDLPKIREERNRIENEIEEFQNRQIIRVPAKIWPLALDYGVRWLVLLGFNYFQVEKDFLTGINIFLVPILILGLVYFAGRSHQKFNKKLLDSHGGERDFKVEYHFSTSQYTWLAFFLGSSVFISYLLPDKLHVLALVGLVLYYFLYVRFFRIGKLTENDLIKQFEKENLNTNSLTVDQNDEVIVSLETKLYSSTSRLEAYVLESALFGALSFSGFLQIMATDLVSFNDLENFADSIYNTSQAIVHFDWVAFDQGFAGLNNKTSLFCLVSVESLICSIFFLAVIASRLRFSDIADKVRTAINLAKAYNAKEEILHDEQEVSGKKLGRLDVLTMKVNEQLHQANLILEEIRPVMKYMEYFRNAGILVFLIILVSSSLFITSALGWIFLALIFATYLYFNRTILNNKFRALFLDFRIAFVKKGYLIFAITFFPQVLAYVLRIFFHVRETDWLITLSYVLIGIYAFAWLILAAHVDEKFGEIEMDKSQQKRWKFVKNTLAVVLLIFAIAMAFKNERLTGANEMMILSLGAVSILMYFVGYYLTKAWWLGIISGSTMGTCSMGILFKTLHLNGANEMFLVSSWMFLIFIVFIVWKRELFHWLLLRFFIVGFLLNLWRFPLIRISASLDTAYVHETLDVKPILEVVEVANALEYFNSNNQPDKRNGKLAESIKKTEWYLQQYGTKNGFTRIHYYLTDVYFEVGDSILTHALKNRDTTDLNSALKVAQTGHSILRIFNYRNDEGIEVNPMEMEAKVLLALNKRHEALKFINTVLQHNPAEDFAKPLTQLRTAIEPKSERATP